MNFIKFYKVLSTVINQIAKDETGISNTTFRQRRVGLRDAIKQPFFNFQKLIKFKKWNSFQNAIVKQMK